MAKEVKASDKVFKSLKIACITIFGIAIVLFGIGRYLEKQTRELKGQQANTTLLIIYERIDEIIENNPDIIDIKTNFEFEGINFIELYVSDTWFNSTDIQKKRYTSNIRDNVKAILFEEGFIKADSRVGIYVYSFDGISLAESGMSGEIKLKEN